MRKRKTRSKRRADASIKFIVSTPWMRSSLGSSQSIDTEVSRAGRSCLPSIMAAIRLSQGASYASTISLQGTNKSHRSHANIIPNSHLIYTVRDLLVTNFTWFLGPIGKTEEIMARSVSKKLTKPFSREPQCTSNPSDFSLDVAPHVSTQSFTISHPQS